MFQTEQSLALLLFQFCKRHFLLVNSFWARESWGTYLPYSMWMASLNTLRSTKYWCRRNSYSEISSSQPIKQTHDIPVIQKSISDVYHQILHIRVLVKPLAEYSWWISVLVLIFFCCLDFEVDWSVSVSSVSPLGCVYGTSMTIETLLSSTERLRL